MNRKQKILNSIMAMTILFIWGHSLMPGDLSAEESSRALDLLKPFLEIFFGKGKVTDHLVRKLAHFSEYALLGCEFCLRQQFLHTASVRQRMLPLRVLVPCLAVCFIDETIQLFVPGRAGMIADMWIDMAGTIAGLLFGLLLERIFRKAAGRKKHRA